ncbi:DNA topoisomerase I, partial [Candidatus Saccharibacteria bacterium]|nr:DNA topoisomerase I [Candidatus Saccharibacteria bacterium]
RKAEALKVIAEKLKAARERVIADFGVIKILRGPYGPYVTNGKKNARIPKDTDPEKLDEKKAKKLLDEAPENTGRRRFRPTKSK